MQSNIAEIVRALALRCGGLLHMELLPYCMMAGPEAGVYAPWFTGAGAAMILGRVSVPR